MSEFAYLVTAPMVVAGTTKGKDLNERVDVLRGQWLPSGSDPARVAHLVSAGLVAPFKLTDDGPVAVLPTTRPTTSHNPGAFLPKLLPALRAAGVTDVPGLVDYERLIPLASKVPGPPMPERWLGLSAEEAADQLREAAYWRSVADRDVSEGFAKQLDYEFAEVIAADADVVIDQMRDRFEPAAARAAELVAMGVTARDTIETLFTKPDEVRHAWVDFTRRWVPALEQVFEARRLLSLAAPVPPQLHPLGRSGEPQESIDWSVAFTRPYVEGVLEQPSGEPPHRRWLRAGSSLHLANVHELTPGALQSASGVRPEPPTGDLLRTPALITT